MAVYRPSQARQQKGQTAPQEPNLVPIMNLFVSIIPFLILMISISQVALLALNFAGDEGGGGAGSSGGGADKEEIVQVHLMLKEHHTGLFPGMEIREPGSTNYTKIPWLAENMYDFDKLNDQLISLKEKYSESSEIAVVVHPEVLYDTLIRTIDLCKANGFVTVHYRSPKNVYIY
jgi:biopolymer transport protein ExbD